jgi:hypothetical protein
MLRYPENNGIIIQNTCISVVTCKLKKIHRTVKHIWFPLTHKANAEKPKELALPHRHPN